MRFTYPEQHNQAWYQSNELDLRREYVRSIGVLPVLKIWDGFEE